MPTLRMEEQEQEPNADEALQDGKHGRDKRFRIENALVNHSVPSTDKGRWVLPKDAFLPLERGGMKNITLHLF